MTCTLQIRLLGPFEVFLDGRPLTNSDWHSQQTRTICKILLTRRGQIVTSDQIIELLWPTDDPASARRRLHVRISQLRRALGSGKSRLQTVEGGYLFQPDETCWLDLDEFQTQILEGARYQEIGQQPRAIRVYEQARQLYRGDFLAEDLYADWTFVEREYYRERFLTLLIELAESYAQQGRYRLALARAHEVQASDPLRESIYVRLMLYHYYAGERPQALRAFERCRAVLAAELDVPPLETTIQLAEQIRTGTLWSSAEAPHYPPPIYDGRLFEVPYTLGETPLVGREREYAWLVSQWQDPTCRVILLEGEAGIGKSRLVEAFAGYVATQGWRLLRTRVTPAGSAPFAPLVAALRPLLSERVLTQFSPAAHAALSTLFPEIQTRSENLPSLPQLPAEVERQYLYQAVADLASSGAATPALFLVDDAHRLGAAALELLTRLTDSFQLLLSYRSEETPPEHPLRRLFGQTALQLEPLSPASVQALIRQLAGHELLELADQISAQSGGHPLFVVALLQNLFETGQLYVDASGGWGKTDELNLALPPTMRAVIENRLQRLNNHQRRIFDFITVLGGEFDFDLLQVASQQPEETLLSSLDDLIAAALLIEPRRQGRAEFAVTHERYTEVAYATLPAVRRKLLHRQAAQAIEALYAGQLSTYFSALAEHYNNAENFERAAYYAAFAGEQAAAQFANAEALRYLDRALTLTPADDRAQHARLLLAREKVHDLQGARQPQDADLTALEALAPHLSLRQQAEISLRRAAFEWILGRNAATETALVETIRQAQDSGAKDLEARAYLLKGRVDKDPSQVRQDFARARKLAQKTGQRALEGDIVRQLGNACFWQGNYSESRARFEEALNIHRAVGDVRGELSALNNLGHVLQLLGQPQKAVQFYEQALTASRKIGDRLAVGVLLTNLGGLKAQLGDFQQAQTWLEQALEIRTQIDNEEGVTVVLQLLADTARQQGQYARSLAHYQRALEIGARLELPKQNGDTLAGLAVLYRTLGLYARAEHYLDQARAVSPVEDDASRVRILAIGCLLNHLRGEPEQARVLGVQAVSQSEKYPAIHAVALTNLGQVLAGLGQITEAQQRFQQALAIRQNLGQLHLIPEPRAGLALLALAQDELATALAQAEGIWQACEDGPLLGPDRPLWVYLACYQVFNRARDARAGEVLAVAHTLLQERAARLEAGELRTAYLEVVSENREITRLWQEFQ